MHDDSLNVIEIFHSLQGESTRAGIPCAFIRLANCNLSCSWCDTRYACTEPGRPLPIPLILAAIQSFRAPLALITGGEPLLQPASATLAAHLVHAGYETIVETNGSLDISVLPYPVSRIMDFKPPSSAMNMHNRMENLALLRHGDEVKILIADRMDYDWASTIIKDADYPRKLVATLFSPVQGKLDPAELAAWILADKLPVRLNLQLHKYIWPNINRGV